MTSATVRTGWPLGPCPPSPTRERSWRQGQAGPTSPGPWTPSFGLGFCGHLGNQDGMRASGRIADFSSSTPHPERGEGGQRGRDTVGTCPRGWDRGRGRTMCPPSASSPAPARAFSLLPTHPSPRPNARSMGGRQVCMPRVSLQLGADGFTARLVRTSGWTPGVTGEPSTPETACPSGSQKEARPQPQAGTTALCRKAL